MTSRRLVGLFLVRNIGGARAFFSSLRLGNGNETEKTILFVRHAEGWHNKDERELPNWHTDQLGLTEKYRDAALTPRGIEQCEELRLSNVEQQPDVVVVSPLSRTLETATRVFTGGPYPFVATELARERIAHHECDHRSPISEVSQTYPHVDFSHVEHDEDLQWLVKEMEPNEYDSTACKQRGQDLLTWLWRRPERRIAVVSHWVFLGHLFRQFPDLPITQFGNAEMRVVALSVDDTADKPTADL